MTVRSSPASWSRAALTRPVHTCSGVCTRQASISCRRVGITQNAVQPIRHQDEPVIRLDGQLIHVRIHGLARADCPGQHVPQGVLSCPLGAQMVMPDQLRDKGVIRGELCEAIIANEIDATVSYVHDSTDGRSESAPPTGSWLFRSAPDAPRPDGGHRCSPPGRPL